MNAYPIGVPEEDLLDSYLKPYNDFKKKKFQGVFDPTLPNKLLNDANNSVTILKTTQLDFDTTRETGGISNIPFIVKQADASAMKSTFWIQELDEKDAEGKSKLRLQYSQIVMLEFFDRTDGMPGKIQWPHVSINTLEKISNETE